MQATIELPDAVVQQLEELARREGATTADLIRRFVEASLNQWPSTTERQYAHLPLIPELETGPIPSVTGAEVDEMLSRDQLTS